MTTATLSLISNDALSVAAKAPRDFWCDCAAQGFDDCHCNDYLMQAEGEVITFIGGDGGGDDDDRTQGDDGDWGPFEFTPQKLIAEDSGKDSDDPTDDRSGGNGGMLRAHLERCLHLTAQDDPDTDTSYVKILGCPPDCGCIYCS